MSTLNLSRIFEKHCISTAAAREIIEAVNAEIEAMAKRMTELELQLGNKHDNLDTLTRTHARGFRFMGVINADPPRRL